MECKTCKISNEEQSLFICDGCLVPQCRKCANLTATETKVLVLKERTMKFYCEDCLKSNTITLLQWIIKDKSEIIENKNKIIELLEKDVKNYKHKEEEIKKKLESSQEQSKIQQVTEESFSNIVKKPSKTASNNLPCLVLKPKTKQNCNETNKDLQLKIKPSKISVGINMVKNSRNGSVILKCDSLNSTRRMKTEIEQNLGQNYLVEETKLRKPSLIIANINTNLSEHEVQEAIKNQNEYLTATDNVEVKTLKKTKKGDSLYAVVECNGSAFSKINTAKKINIGFNRCPIYENLQLLRCHKCCGYNHKIADCKKTNFICPKCSGPHALKECVSSQVNCINCTIYNERHKTTFEVDHDASSSNCSVYKKNLGILKERIDYTVI